MRIGELAKQGNVHTSTIRYWERRGLLRPAWRSGRGQRTYDTQALDRLAFIRGAKASGLTLTEIRQLLSGFPATTAAPTRWRSVRAAKLRALEQRIAELRAAHRRLAATRACHCRDLDTCGRRLRRMPGAVG